MRSRPWVGNFSQSRTNSLAARYGSGRMSSALIKLNTAVFAPIPSASVRIATAVKPGDFTNWRNAYRTSFILLQSFHPQRFNGIHEAGTPRRQETGEECNE